MRNPPTRIALTGRAHRMFEFLARLRGPWRVRVPGAGRQLRVARVVNGQADWDSAVVVAVERLERGPA